MSTRERGLVPFEGECEGDGCNRVVSVHLPRTNSVANGTEVKVRCCECKTTNNLGVGYVE